MSLRVFSLLFCAIFTTVYCSTNPSQHTGTEEKYIEHVREIVDEIAEDNEIQHAKEVDLDQARDIDGHEKAADGISDDQSDADIERSYQQLARDVSDQYIEEKRSENKGVHSAFGTSYASDLIDVLEKLTEVETNQIGMVDEIAAMKVRLQNLEREKESTTSCPDRWMAYKGSCYYFGSIDVPFSEAQHTCTSFGAHMVHVQDYMENMFLKGFMHSHSNHDYWVGLTDLAKEGLWKLTGKSREAPFLNWDKSEPKGGTSENCAIFAVVHQHQWADVSCFSKFRYLCERS